jgi:glutaredoxin 3
MSAPVAHDKAGIPCSLEDPCSFHPRMSKRIMAKVLIYKKIPCPYCDRAIAFLNNKGVAYDVIDLTDKQEEMDRIKNETGWRTVPIIMIDGKLIGGYTDMKALDEEGKLDELLK